MPRPKQSAAVVAANGNRRHLSRAELAEREASTPDVRLLDVRPPASLPESLRGEFEELAAKLVACGIATELDADELARYVVARKAWADATALYLRVFETGDADQVAKAQRVQDTAYRQCERSGATLGLNPSGRVGLVPKREEPRRNRFADLAGAGASDG